MSIRYIKGYFSVVDSFYVLGSHITQEVSDITVSHTWLSAFTLDYYKLEEERVQEAFLRGYASRKGGGG